MDWAWVIPIPVFIVYTIRILTYLSGWKKATRSDLKAKSGTAGSVSVIIPVRNEETRIQALLGDLQTQHFPARDFEIIIVDDHSTDQTAAVVQSHASGNAGTRLVELGEDEVGKKAAIRRGVLEAAHEVIISTDGDCRVPTDWLGLMLNAIREPGIRMVGGPVMIEPDKGCFQAMQSLEFISLTGVSAASAGLGDPLMCNAANLAYLKEDYLHYLETDQQGPASGDDMFLMLWLKKMYPGSVRFITDPAAVIRTLPADSLQSFVMQRLRWVSKSRFYRDLHLISTALLVFLVNACLFMTALLCLLGPRWIILFLLLLGTKVLIDGIFLLNVLKHFGKRKLLLVFLPLELIYFIYVSMIGAAGQVTPYTWKGRNIKP